MIVIMRESRLLRMISVKEANTNEDIICLRLQKEEKFVFIKKFNWKEGKICNSVRRERESFTLIL